MTALGIVGMVFVIGIPCAALGWWLHSEQYRAHWREHTREWKRWQDTNCGACQKGERR
jgi:hypothetical protein